MQAGNFRHEFVWFSLLCTMVLFKFSDTFSEQFKIVRMRGGRIFGWKIQPSFSGQNWNILSFKNSFQTCILRPTDCFNMKVFRHHLKILIVIRNPFNIVAFAYHRINHHTGQNAQIEMRGSFVPSNPALIHQADNFTYIWDCVICDDIKSYVWRNDTSFNR